jgi:uncharacterized DUF497 family protein
MIDKQCGIEHFKVNHPDVSKEDIEQVFENTYIEFEQTKHIKRILGHNHKKRFFVLIVIFDKNKTYVKLITAYRAKKKDIQFYLNEVRK